MTRHRTETGRDGICRGICAMLRKHSVRHIRQHPEVLLGGHWCKLCDPGVPDVQVLDPRGWLEVKTESGVLSADQVEWSQWLRDRDWRVAVVTSEVETMRVLQHWRAEDAAERRRKAG
jgi:hypothetical protein